METATRTLSSMIPTHKTHTKQNSLCWCCCCWSLFLITPGDLHMFSSACCVLLCALIIERDRFPLDITQLWGKKPQIILIQPCHFGNHREGRSSFTEEAEWNNHDCNNKAWVLLNTHKSLKQQLMCCRLHKEAFSHSFWLQQRHENRFISLPGDFTPSGRIA